MDQLDEFAKDIVDRYIKSMGYNPQTIDRNRRMALTKTIRFQQFAQRMQNEEIIIEQPINSPTAQNKPSSMGISQTRVHTKDMALKRRVHANKPQSAVATEALEFPGNDGIDPKGSSSRVVGERAKGMSRNANLIKALYKKHKVKKEVKEELYDHEKDDKGGESYGKKPKFAKVKDGQQDDQSDSKPKAAAILTGGTTLTGQKRDDVEFDPMLNKPNNKSDASGMQIKADKKKINR
jgi:hypothetical protein